MTLPFDRKLMVEACAGGLTFWGVPKPLGRKIMEKKIPHDTTTCWHCGGTGQIPLTGIYAETLDTFRRSVKRNGYIVANRDAGMFGCKPTALNNRLRKLEEHGHVYSERYGRQRRFFLCVLR